jgi:hypothetical protein
VVILERQLVLDSAEGFCQNTQNPWGEVRVDSVVNPKPLTSVEDNACFS